MTHEEIVGFLFGVAAVISAGVVGFGIMLLLLNRPK